MATISKKLEDRLNRLYELGGEQFGTILKQCLAEAGGSPIGGACLTVPAYADQDEMIATCGEEAGFFFLNQSTGGLEFYDGVEWISLDISAIQGSVTANTAAIALNTTNITNIISQINFLSTNFDNHTHDGVNSPAFDIKNLTSSGPVNSFFFSTGSGVDCREINESVDFQLGGASVSESQAVNFTTACFAVTESGGVVTVDIPDLPGVKLASIANTAGIATNATSISNLSTNLTNLQNDFLNHNHDGAGSPQLTFDAITSDIVGTPIQANAVICSNGNSGWVFVDKDTLAGGDSDLFEVKTLMSDQAITGPTPDLSWGSGLTIGNYYEVIIHAHFSKGFTSTPSSEEGFVNIQNGTTQVLEVRQTANTGDFIQTAFSGHAIFQATSTSLSVEYTSGGSAPTVLQGNGSLIRTHITLKELNSSTPTVFI